VPGGSSSSRHRGPSSTPRETIPARRATWLEKTPP
jgi:hypothetical protein